MASIEVRDSIVSVSTFPPFQFHCRQQHETKLSSSKDITFQSSISACINSLVTVIVNDHKGCSEIMISNIGSSSNNSKRRRTLPSAGGEEGLHTLQLTDLSNDQLIAIADYLPKTSRAIFAVALTAPLSSWRDTNWTGMPCEASRAIIESTKPMSVKFERTYVGYSYLSDTTTRRNAMRNYYEATCPWSILDFVDLEDNLACKITDEELSAILVCINAKATLKKMILSNRCNKLTGIGLEPLRGSVVLEEIDIGTLTYQSFADCVSRNCRALAPIPLTRDSKLRWK